MDAVSRVEGMTDPSDSEPRLPLHIRAQNHMQEFPEVWASYGITIGVLTFTLIHSFRRLRQAENNLRVAHQNYLIRLARQAETKAEPHIVQLNDADDDLKRFPDVQLPERTAPKQTKEQE